MSNDLKPCPFCGCELGITTSFDHEQGDKWGYASCGECAARGPEVRTQYAREHDAPWHYEAIAAWNTRAIDPAAIRKAALREAADICIGVSKDVWTQLGLDHERWMKATAEDCSKMILSRAALSERDKSHE